MQSEAERLKNHAVGGTRTTVIALGITSNINVDELMNMATRPHNKNVILVPHFSISREVEEQLRSASCSKYNLCVSNDRRC